MQNTTMYAISLLLLLLAAGRHIDGQDPAPDVTDPLAGLDSQMVTRRSVAKLTCEASQMVVDLTFNEPFFGRISMENSPNDTTCQSAGNGATIYRVVVPFKGCGTTQRDVRVYENNMRINFETSSQNLQLQREERKTILCRQPPPVAPPVVNPLPPVIVAPIGVPAPIVELPAPNITEFTILIPLVLVLVLGCLMCGLCCAWWWMKKRRTVVERQRSIASEHGGSEITKLTGSTFPPIVAPVLLKIPRAVAPPSLHSSYGSSGSSAASEAGLVRHLEGAERLSRSYASSSDESLSVHETYGYDQAAAAAAAQQQQQQQHMAIVEYRTETREAPPLPPPPPQYYPESDRETLKNFTEYEVERAALARPPPPPLPPQQLTIRRKPIPPPQIDMQEADHESISVIESLENEIVVTAVRQQKPPSPPLLTETQTVEYFDNTKRSFTQKSDETLTRRPPPPRPTTFSTKISQSEYADQRYSMRLNEDEQQQQQWRRSPSPPAARTSQPRPLPPVKTRNEVVHDNEYEQQRSSSTYNTRQYVQKTSPSIDVNNPEHLFYRSKPARPTSLPAGPQASSTTRQQQQSSSSTREQNFQAYSEQQQRLPSEPYAMDVNDDDDDDNRTPTPKPTTTSTRYRVEQILRVGSPEPPTSPSDDVDRRPRRPLDWNVALRLIETPHITPVSQRTTKITTTKTAGGDPSFPNTNGQQQSQFSYKFQDKSSTNFMSSPSSPTDDGVVPRDSTVFSRSMQARKREIEQFSSALDEDDATRLQSLMLHDGEFKRRVTTCRSIGALLQLTRDTQYAHLFTHEAWQTIVRIFARVLDLPRAANNNNINEEDDDNVTQAAVVPGNKIIKSARISVQANRFGARDDLSAADNNNNNNNNNNNILRSTAAASSSSHRLMSSSASAAHQKMQTSSSTRPATMFATTGAPTTAFGANTHYMSRQQEDRSGRSASNQQQQATSRSTQQLHAIIMDDEMRGSSEYYEEPASIMRR